MGNSQRSSTANEEYSSTQQGWDQPGGYNGVDNMLTIPLPSIPLEQSTQQEQSLFTIKHHYATQHDTQHDTHIETSPLRALALTPQAKARYLQ